MNKKEFIYKKCFIELLNALGLLENFSMLKGRLLKTLIPE
jgi:hypothetical protein